jgi:predicted dehydrogenase
MAQALRVGIVGAGRFGARIAAALAAREDAALALVHDETPARAEMLAARHGAGSAETLAAMLGAVDAVVAATSPASHAMVGLAAVAAGVPVLVKPPLAVLRPEALELMEAAEAAGVLCLTARPIENALLAAGLGQARERPHAFEASRTEPSSGEAASVSVTLEMMLEDIEHALALFGGPAVAVRASASAGRPDRPDAVAAVIRFAGGGEARLRASRAGPGRARTLRCLYASGVVDADLLEGAVSSSCRWSLDLGRMQAMEQDAGLDRFLLAVRTGDPPPVNARARDALDLAFHIDAICRAGVY